MLFLRKIDIADNERGLLFKRNNLTKVLSPGRYRFWDFTWELRVEKYDIGQIELQHSLGRILITTYDELTKDYVDSYEINEQEVALVYFNGILTSILAPGSFKMYWRSPEKIEVRKIDISENFEIDKKLMPVIAYGKALSSNQHMSYAVNVTEVADGFVGLLQIDGEFVKTLKSGTYGFWKYGRNITVKQMDTRLQNMEVSGQEILTKDRVSLRINLTATYQLDNPEKVARELVNYADYMYKELQLHLREAVGTQTLDALLVDKDNLNKVIDNGIRYKVGEYGIKVKSVGVKDIILPGDMKMILNQVVEAEKSAEANLIKRREETAATRSLHNTAKVMESNPTLMRLKELEVLEKITENIDQITVYGGLEGVFKELVKLPGISNV